MIKNLTKTQVEIEGLAGRVPKLTDKQKEWAIRNYSYSFYHMSAKTECVCPNCHHAVPMEKTDNIHKQTQHLKCPHCGAKIVTHRYFDGRETRYHKSRETHQEKFFQVMNVVGDWQVTRLIYMQRWTYIRKESTPWEFYEVCQAWNNPNYKTTHFRSLPKNCIGYHYNPYSLHRWRYECTDPDNDYYNKYIEDDNELEARRPGSSNYFNTDDIAPDARIHPSFKKMGITIKALKRVKYLTALGLLEGFSNGNYKPEYETLLKDGAYEVFDRITDTHYRNDAYKYFTAWKLCKRHHYDYKKSLSEWFDTLDMLFDRDLDYHNPKYVCPADLHGLHNHLLELKRREEERRAEEDRRARIERLHRQTEKEMKDIEKANKSFVERRKEYFDLCIKGEFFNIVALKSVMEFKQEGAYLGHCVFRCGYYRKENSLILSARDANNNPIETIEIDLRSFTILQCYGEKDTHTVLHDKIVKTMKENMWRVKEIRLAKKAKRAA